MPRSSAAQGQRAAALPLPAIAVALVAIVAATFLLGGFSDVDTDSGVAGQMSGDGEIAGKAGAVLEQWKKDVNELRHKPMQEAVDDISKNPEKATPIVFGLLIVVALFMLCNCFEGSPEEDMLPAKVAGDAGKAAGDAGKAAGDAGKSAGDAGKDDATAKATDGSDKAADTEATTEAAVAKEGTAATTPESEAASKTSVSATTTTTTVTTTTTTKKAAETVKEEVEGAGLATPEKQKTAPPPEKMNSAGKKENREIAGFGPPPRF